MRTILIVLVLAIAGYFLLGYSNQSLWSGRTGSPAPVTGTTGTIDREKARERGAELGEKAAIATEHIREAAHEATITTKIKAKMALDDSVKSRTIDVSTDGSTVTLSGSVGSAEERRRAVALARETDGVKAVIDRLVIQSH